MEGINSGKQENSFPLAPVNRWSSSWPIFFSLVLHGLMVCLLLTWSVPQPAENPPKIVTIRILENEKENNPLPPAPIESKPKIVPRHKRTKPDPPQIGFAKEAEAPPTLSPPAAEPTIHEIVQITDEKKIEELPEEKQKQEAETAPLGVPEGRKDADVASLGRAGASSGLIADSGLAEKGIPGGLPLAALAGEGAGKEGVGQGGGIGEGAIPSQGGKTGNVLFHGEGERKGKRDLSSYLGNARLRIERAKRYPREARRMGWEGKVVLSFQIDQNGEVGEIAIIQSSSYPELDEEGITTIRRAAPFLPPPLAGQGTLEVKVPLVFMLE